ncbi:S-layer homology domain-containing protein [Paenibacillus kobensis]|uniref:S-layer homology domain-containing protein n=1 Tax=Paenibacillus kobensis TaxID=59841 RepID=UPI000FD8AD93|nr:S-layer homology domain-containing protein [Paenibacillus kobensis]
MRNRLMKRSIVWLFTLLLASGSAFTATASSVSIVSVSDDGTTMNVELNAVIDVAQNDFDSMIGSGITFTLADAAQQAVGQPIVRNVAAAGHTVTDSVYAVAVDALSFGHLVPGAAYTLKAAYQGADGSLREQVQPVQIVAPSYTFKVEHIKKDETTAVVAMDGTVRSDDASIKVTVLNEYNMPVKNKDIRIRWNRRGDEGHAVTDSNGQLELNSNSSNPLGYSHDEVVILSVDEDSPTYAVGTIYYEDLIAPGAHYAEMRYLDKNGRVLSAGSYSQIEYDGIGISEVYSVSGVDIWTTNYGWGNLRKTLRASGTGDLYMYSASAEELTAAAGLKHSTVMLNASNYSQLKPEYTWNGQPVSVVRAFAADAAVSNHTIRSNTTMDWMLDGVQTIYMPAGQSCDVIVTLALPTGDKAIVHQTLTAADDSRTFGGALEDGAFSALDITTDYHRNYQSVVKVGYMDERNNNYFESSAQLDSGQQLFVEKNKPVYKVNAIIDNADNEAIIADQLTPSEDRYTFHSGRAVDAEVTVMSRSSKYSGVTTPQSSFTLGDTLKVSLDFTDGLSNSVDMGSPVLATVEKDGQVVMDNLYVYSDLAELTGKLKQMFSFDYSPDEPGAYTITFKQDPSKNQPVTVAATSFTVLPQHQMDIEIRDASGQRVDLANKPYLTIEQAKQLSFTVREHGAGQIGNPIEGVQVSTVNGSMIGSVVSDASGVAAFESPLEWNTELSFTKEGYSSQTMRLPIIDPARQAVIRISGLDRAEDKPGLQWPGGAPMQNASIHATVKSADGTVSIQSDNLIASETVDYMVVPAPSVVDLDYLRPPGYYGSDSRYGLGYYLVGSVTTEAGGDYSVTLDARQHVSSVEAPGEISQIYAQRAGLESPYYMPNLMSYNPDGTNRFYAASGRYDMMVIRPNGGGAYYLEDVNIDADTYTLNIPSGTGTLAELKTNGNNVINYINYYTGHNADFGIYNDGDRQRAYVTPGNIIVSVTGRDGNMVYQYQVSLGKDELSAGQVTMINPSPAQGLGIIGMNESGEVTVSPSNSTVRWGMINSEGDEVSIYRFRKYVFNIVAGEILDSNSAGSYVLKNSKGEEIQSGSFYGGMSGFLYAEAGEYTVEASLTFDGKTYTLNRTFTVVKSEETPGTTDPGSGEGGSAPINPNPPAMPIGGIVPAGQKGSPSISDVTKGLNDLLSGNVLDNESADKAAKLLGTASSALKDTKDSEAAEQSIEDVSASIGMTAKLLGSMKDEREKEKVAKALVQLVNDTQYAFEHMASSITAAALIKSIMKDTGLVLQQLKGADPTLIGSLQDALVGLGKKAAEKAATITLDAAGVKVEGNVLAAVLDASFVERQLGLARTALDGIVKEITAVVGEDKAASINTVVTIHIPKKDNQAAKLSVDMPSDIIKAIQDSGLSGLKLSFNDVGFTIGPNTFGQAAGGQTIHLAAEMADQMTAAAPASAEKLAKVPVMDLSASIGGKKIESFSQPIQVTFDVSSIDTSKYTEEDLANLTVYILNEKTVSWEPVGGVYDPVSKTIRVNRGHFSKYTVMKPSLQFTDIPANNWAAGPVNRLLNKGILDAESSFNPSAKVTREQFAAWIVRAYGLDGTGLKADFKDVAADNPYYDEIAAAYQYGIIQGKSADSFAPKAPITRQEIATILSRTLLAFNGLHPAGDSKQLISIFKDGTDIAAWHRMASL